jgi:hypothetical protein
MAWPATLEKDYKALNSGIVSEFPKSTKSETKRFKAELNKENFVDDETLKTYVDDIIREDLRNSSFSTLIKAKNKPKAIKAYFNFVNAYQIYKNGDDSYGNICCLAIDDAKKLLK